MGYIRVGYMGLGLRMLRKKVKKTKRNRKKGTGKK